jgi:hypothetical protein
MIESLVCRLLLKKPFSIEQDQATKYLDAIPGLALP